MKILIVEDEANHRENLRHILSENIPGVDINFHDKIKGLVAKIDAFEPDVLFLDVELPDGKTTDHLKLDTLPCAVIFITSYEKYAVDAFKLSALDFLLKPVGTKDMLRSLEKVQEEQFHNAQKVKLKALIENLSQKTKNILINTNTDLHIVPTQNVIYCEALSSYTVFHCINDTKYTASANLKEFHERIGSFGFFRIHKSYMINLSQIKKVSKANLKVLLKNGVELPISRNRKDIFFKSLENELT
ncbi:MAG: LytTR family DNA-binding domain-containing protein [Flavobacteriales bacterium]|nr:LytTR family DNA-binding domain-containing protein [Flavobacteriales bacterium]